MTQRDRSQLLRDLKAAVPQITTPLNAEQGQLHFEVAVFQRIAQRAIEAGDRELVARCFALADMYLTEGNAAVRDAIDVSFVEPLQFGSRARQRCWAWEAMPEALKRAYVAFHTPS